MQYDPTKKMTFGQVMSRGTDQCEWHGSFKNRQTFTLEVTRKGYHRIKSHDRFWLHLPLSPTTNDVCLSIRLLRPVSLGTPWGPPHAVNIGDSPFPTFKQPVRQMFRIIQRNIKQLKSGFQLLANPAKAHTCSEFKMSPAGLLAMQTYEFPDPNEETMMTRVVFTTTLTKNSTDTLLQALLGPQWKDHRNDVEEL